MLQGQLDEIINEHNQFRQTIIEQKQNPSNSILLKQIDHWEQISIEKIRRTAQESRDLVIGQTRRVVDTVEEKLGQFTRQLREVRQENEFNETDLHTLANKLTEMASELTQLSNISIQEDSQILIKKIQVSLSNPRQRQESKYHKWKQQANTVAGGNEQGQQLNQLYHPYGIFVDPNETIFIADYYNHRIVRWEWQMNKGTVIAGGTRKDQLNCPRDVITDRNNHSIIIADWGNRRVIRCFVCNVLARQVNLSR